MDHKLDKVITISRMATNTGLGTFEAANFAIRHSEKADQFYLRKAKATKHIVATKALAHKLCKACYWILKNGESYNEEKIFG